jgi:hypothetical protein
MPPCNLTRNNRRLLLPHWRVTSGANVRQPTAYQTESFSCVYNRLGYGRMCSLGGKTPVAAAEKNTVAMEIFSFGIARFRLLACPSTHGIC